MDYSQSSGLRRADHVLVRLDSNGGARRRGRRTDSQLASGQRPLAVVGACLAGAALRHWRHCAYAARLFPAMTAWMRLTCLAGIAAAAFGGANAALAGGQMNFGDETNTSANDGPPFFGFIRDSNGSSIPGAKVTATVKSGGALVTRSNSMGVYKIPGFAKEIDP